MNHDEIPAGWEERTLGSVTERIASGSTPSTANPSYWNGDIVWVTPDDLSGNDHIYMRDSARRISKKGLENSSARLIPKGSIVMSSRAPIGYVAIMEVDYSTNQGCKSLVLKDALPEFVYYSLIFNMSRIKQLGEGTTFSEISKTQLEKVTIPLPRSRDEQQKTATILQAVDKAIEKTKELIEKHKRIKEGLMQDFFERTGHQNGTRLVALGNPDYARLATGGTPSTLIREYWGGTIRWMNSGDVHKKKIYEVDGRITDKGYENSNATFIPKDSILIALAGQGKTRGTVAINKIELTTNQSVAAVVPNPKRVHPQYLYHLLDSKYQELRSISAGAGRAGLSLSILAKYTVAIPESMSEQVKVASILEATDKRLDSELTYARKLEGTKMGLMQDLLTGRVRSAA